MENKTPKIISAKQIQRQFNFLKMVAALSIAVLIIMVVVFLIADEPLDALGHFFLGPFDSVRHLGNIIENATPVLFTGIATCLLFAAGDVTLVGEGAVGWIYWRSRRRNAAYREQTAFFGGCIGCSIGWRTACTDPGDCKKKISL